MQRLLQDPGLVPPAPARPSPPRDLAGGCGDLGHARAAQGARGGHRRERAAPADCGRGSRREPVRRGRRRRRRRRRQLLAAPVVVQQGFDPPPPRRAVRLPGGVREPSHPGPQAVRPGNHLYFGRLRRLPGALVEEDSEREREREREMQVCVVGWLVGWLVYVWVVCGCVDNIERMGEGREESQSAKEGGEWDQRAIF